MISGSYDHQAYVDDSSSPRQPVATAKGEAKGDVTLHSKKRRVTSPLASTSGIKAAQKVEKDDLCPAGSEQSYGVDIVLKAVESPLRQMVENAGGMPDVVLSLSRDLEEGMGFDLTVCENGQESVDLFAKGIIDPFKVVRTALQNAVSAAGTLITSSHAIIAN